MNLEPALNSTIRAERLEFTAIGSWTIAHSEVSSGWWMQRAPVCQRPERGHQYGRRPGARYARALGLLERLIRVWRERGQQAEYTLLPEHFRGLLDEMREVNSQPGGLRAKPNRVIAALDALGRATVGSRDDILAFLDMLGGLGMALARVLGPPAQLRLTSRCIISAASVGTQCPLCC